MTTFSLRDVGIAPGQSLHEQLELELVPYVQGEVEYRVAGGSVPARLDVTVMTQGTSFRLRFDARYEGPCSRCLEPASLEVSVDAHAVHDEHASEDEMRCEHVDDQLHELDVTAWAQEEVALQFPTRVLCRDSCRGLCGQCGVNLNEAPDHAHEQPLDSRWDALKALKVDELDT